MIVVSDTTPLRYLIELEAVHLLETLFGQVIILQEIANELQGTNTPQKVKDWMRACPDWLEVRAVDASGYVPIIEIHTGEREAIALALELATDGILIDDKDARIEAQRAGLTIIPKIESRPEIAALHVTSVPLLCAVANCYPKRLERYRREKSVCGYNAAAMEYQVFVEQHANNGYVAEIIGLPNCQVVGQTEEEAISKAKKALAERLTHGKVVTIKIEPETAPEEQPEWKNFGRLKDDPTFDDLMEHITEYRRQLDEEDSAK